MPCVLFDIHGSNRSRTTGQRNVSEARFECKGSLLLAHVESYGEFQNENTRYGETILT